MKQLSIPSILAAEKLNRPAAEELRQLLRETQQLPAAKAVCEGQIAEEIAEYRAGRRRLSSMKQTLSPKKL